MASVSRLRILEFIPLRPLLSLWSGPQPGPPRRLRRM